MPAGLPLLVIDTRSGSPAIWRDCTARTNASVVLISVKVTFWQANELVVMRRNQFPEVPRETNACSFVVAVWQGTDCDAVADIVATGVIVSCFSTSFDNGMPRLENCNRF